MQELESVAERMEKFCHLHEAVGSFLLGVILKEKSYPQGAQRPLVPA